MSCRLLRNGGPEVTSLFEHSPRKPDADVKAWHSGEASEATATADAENAALRQRIVELEAILPSRVDEARQNGFRAGEAAGRERATEATRPVLDRLTASLSQLSAARGRMRSEAEHDVVLLSLAIARRILRREVSIDPDAIQGLVRSAMEKLQARDISRVRVCPDHKDVIHKALTAVHAGAVEIIADPSLSPGDVLFETARGDLDACIDTQLAEIERGFADRLR